LTIRKIEMPMRSRQAAVAPASLKLEERSFELVWATDAPASVEMWDREFGYITGDEILSMEPGHCRTARMEGGLPLLDHHQRHTGQLGQIGKVVDCALADGKASGRAIMSRREVAQEILQDVHDGIADTFSVGYRVYAYEVTKREGVRDVYRAIDWEPLEVSFEPIPADPGARARSGTPADDTRSCEIRVADETEAEVAEVETVAVTLVEEKNMPLDQKQMMKLMSRAAELDMSLDLANAVIAAGGEKSFEDLTDDLVRSAKEQRAKVVKLPDPERATPSTQLRAGHEQITTDQAEKDGKGIIEYIEHRATGGELTENGRRFMGMSLFDLARKALVDTGRSPIGGRFEIVREALQPTRLVRRTMGGIDRERDVGGLHTTSDFGDLLGDGVLRRRLLAAYNSMPDSYSSFVSTTTFADPRSQKFIRIGSFGTLAEVKEGAEYKRKSFGSEAEDIDIAKHGGIIGLSLEAILRDDLSAFARMPTMLGHAAKKTEQATVFGVLTANPLMSDGFALFSAQHANLGGANAPDVTGITDARTIMRKQKDVALTGATDRLGLTPRHIVIPYKYELGLAQLVGPDKNQPDATSDIVPRYIRDMTYSVSDVLDANSTQIWYAFANPNEIETLVVARLEGNQPFEIERRSGWEVDGLEWKIRHWFGAGVVDWRGAYRNPGV